MRYIDPVLHKKELDEIDQLFKDRDTIEFRIYDSGDNTSKDRAAWKREITKIDKRITKILKGLMKEGKK